MEISACFSGFFSKDEPAISLMQGTNWIERFSMAVVPTMTIFFFGGCTLYLLLHTDYLWPAFRQICSSAFGLSSIGGGIAGYSLGKALRYGVARGLFTNEAGLGTAGLIEISLGHRKPDTTTPPYHAGDNQIPVFPNSWNRPRRISVGISDGMAVSLCRFTDDGCLWQTSPFWR